MNLRQILLLGLLTTLGFGVASAQLPGPGAESQKERYKQFEATGLAKDSVVSMDTVIVFDPETYEETMTVTRSVFSIYDYCQQMLGISNPDMLLDGKVHEISNPVTYEKMKIQWNPAAGKIDTIPN